MFLKLKPTSMDLTAEEELVQSINAVLSRIVEHSYDQRVEGLLAIEQKFLWLDNTDPVAYLEIKRRVAEEVLLVAQEKAQPIEECERRLQRVLVLGWSDRYRAAEVLLPFSRYCMLSGRPELARTYLEPVARELEWLPPSSAEAELRANLLEAVRQRLREL